MLRKRKGQSTLEYAQPSRETPVFRPGKVEGLIYGMKGKKHKKREGGHILRKGRSG